MSAAVQRAVVLTPAFGRRNRQSITLRSAVPADAEAIYRLIAAHAAEGRLLPRTIDDISAHIDRFAIAVADKDVAGCVDLAPLSRTVAEVRSLVVDASARARGVGRRLVDEVTARALAANFETLCAFTHSPGYFIQAGFSIVPHAWVPEKIERDCRGCSLFRTCGQYALALPLGAAARFVAVSAVNG